MPLIVTVSAQGKVFGVNIGTVLRCNYNLDLFMFVHICIAKSKVHDNFTIGL